MIWPARMCWPLSTTITRRLCRRYYNKRTARRRPMLQLSREGPAPLIRREDYAAPPFWIREVDLTFDLDGAKTLVASKLRVERNPDQPAQPLRLHGEDLTLLRVMADGQSVSFRHEADGSLVIDNPPGDDAFTLEIRSTCVPDKNTQLSGLYTSE